MRPLKPWLSFLKEWGLLTLTLASGAPSVIFLLIFSLQGKEPPKAWIWHSLIVCSLLSAWAFAYRERKLRQQMEHTPAQPDIVPMSASVIRNAETDGQFIPRGNGFAAVCCLYYHEGGRVQKDVRAQLIFRSLQTNTEVLRVKTACWLHERTPGVTFKPGTTRHVVVAEWDSRMPVSVPKFVATELETIPLPLGGTRPSYGIALHEGRLDAQRVLLSNVTGYTEQWIRPSHVRGESGPLGEPIPVQVGPRAGNKVAARKLYCRRGLVYSPVQREAG